MAILERTISYQGDFAAAPIKRIVIEFDIPELAYRTREIEGGAVVDRSVVGRTSVQQPHALDSAEYRATFASGLLCGRDLADFAAFRAYSMQAIDARDLEALTVNVEVRYLADGKYRFGGQQLELLCLPLLEPLANTSNPPRTNNIRSENRNERLRKGLLAINRVSFVRLLEILAADMAIDERSLIELLYSLIEFKGDEPVLRRKINEGFKQALASSSRELTEKDIEKALDVIQKEYTTLFDFPLSVPTIEALTIAGRLTISSTAKDKIVASDFLNYELTAQVPVGQATPEILRFKFDPDVEVLDGGAAFDFGNTAIFRGSVRDVVLVKVSARDGSVPWSTSLEAGSPTLAHLVVVVPLVRPATVAKPTYVIDKSKRLRGQVLELRKKCALKGIGVVIQARTADDAPWKVVAAGATDQSGNFSLSYPYGIYTAARAIVSVAPDEPVEVAIKAYKNPKQTIADDFLYLLVKEFDCPHEGTGEDCDCHRPKKAGRLPDYADLIESDEYTQDIGGACVNLSTPNRTLSEFNYQAIVRTSDPEVSNYTLKKTEVVTTGVDTTIQLEFLRGASELIDAISLPQVAAGFTAEAMATAKANASALAGISTGSTEPDIKAALGRLNAVIERFNVLSTPAFEASMPFLMRIVEIARRLKAMLLTTLGTRTETRYELAGGNPLLTRRKVGLNNPIRWQDAPEAKANLSLYQAVSVATGHLLHYKVLLKADGYSLGDLIYSLPLAPGQKKEIVVYDMSHTLTGTESQALSQGERLSAAIVNERDIVTQLGGRISESMRGNSTANTSGISFGLGTGGSGSGSTGAYGGSGSAVIGVAGGFANANSNAASDSSRDVSQFFGEKLRQSIMQNAEGYRQQNASVVTTVQEGQRYSVTSEVIANHNHCHALTMMYFEVLRHYAIFQELSSVEECVFVPLLMTEFTRENIHKWRDVLATSLLPIPSNTYLPGPVTVDGRYAHPLVRAFDANERIKTRYENVDFPVGSFDEDPIRFVRGSMRLRVNLPRPRTRFDRILSLPITTQTITTREFDPEATALSALEFPRKVAEYSAKVAATAGLYALFNPPPPPPSAQYSVQQQQVLVREAIFDACMSLDANFQTARPADCIRITNFKPPATIGTIFGPLAITSPAPLDFFADNAQDKEQWQAYSKLLGYNDPLKMLEVYFKGNLISEWDAIFNNDIAPLIFEQIVKNIRLSDIAVDFSSESRYRGGERLMRLNVTGNTTRQRNQLPGQLRMSVNNQTIKSMQSFVTLNVEDVTLTYSTTHYEGMLFSGVINDDLLDDTSLYIPESLDERRNPRKDDVYLVSKLVDHLNSNLEYYNKALWYNLDPDRRYMLLDGFNIEVRDDLDEPLEPRSLASIVKNELIAVTGNSMVFPVAAGCRVDRSVVIVRREEDGEFEKITLLDHYKPLTPSEPYRVSVPSKGVFAEAVQGACNACEKIETERLQDWTKFPNPDEPTPIAPITTPTPVVTDWRAAFKEFAPPLVSIQNAPAAPAPGAGLAGVSELLGKSGVFNDITGLEGNQQNVMRTYLSNQENAKAFAEMAKEMAMQNHNTQNSGRIMDSLKAAKDEGALNQKDFGDLVKDHLQQQIDGGITKRAQLEEQRSASSTPLTKAVVDAAGHGRSVKAQTMDGEGGSESVSIDAGGEAGEHQVLAEATGVQSVAQPNSRTCWAAVSSMMCMWRDPEQFQSIDDVMVAAGDKFVQLYNKGRGNGRGLPMSDKREFLTALEMVSEPGGASYPLQSYVDWLNDYGPLWITIDAEPDPDEFARHAIIVIRISGTGTPDSVGTDVTYIDPIGAKTRTVAFSEFIADYESLANFQKDSPPSIQVVHFKDVANDSGEGGGKGAAGVAGAAAAVGEKALDTAFDVVGEYLKAELAAGSGTAQLPSNMMFPIDRTKADDYGTGGPMQDAIRQCRITFENLAGTGPGDGLEGYVTLQWFSTNYLGPIASKTKRSTVRHLRSIKFAQAITGTGFLIVGGALISADVDVSLFPLKVESKVAGSYQPIAVQIKIAAKAKTAAGDSVMMTKVVMLHPEDPVNYKLVYVRNPRKDVKVEVDATP